MSFALTSPSHLSFRSVSSFDPYADDVRVTPGARRQRQSNRVRQRVALYEALEASVGAADARRIQDIVETRGVGELTTADRAAFDAAENVVEGEDEQTVSPSPPAAPPSAAAAADGSDSSNVSEASSLRPGEIASTPVGALPAAPSSQIRSAPPGAGRLVATDRSGNVSMQNASEQYIRRGLSALRSVVNPPAIGPSPYATRLGYGVGPPDSDPPARAASEPRRDTIGTPNLSPITQRSSDLSTFRNLDFSETDGSPTLGSSTSQLQNLAESIDTLANQVETGMQALSRASSNLNGASPDERVKLLGTLQSDPQLQELVKAGLMNWNDLMRPNPAEGSEGYVSGVEEGEPVLDPKKLAELQSKLSTAAQKQANDLARVQQVVERRRTTPGAVPPASGALYPGLKVWMPPAFAPPVPPGRS